MNARTTLRSGFLFVPALVVVLQASCARSQADDVTNDPRVFAPATNGSNLCVDTVCPAPFATCPGARGVCTVDLRTDIDHCGACATPCPSSAPHGGYVCSDGACRVACAPYFADCNGSPDDGCEISTLGDPANCGACGAACNEGVLCWKGACGCPNGFTQCGQDCVKLDADNDNCSACGSLCRAPETADDPRWKCGPSVTPKNTKWTCGNSSCELRCKPPYADCNDDFCGDGCELNVSSDPQNCGACGNKCGDGQTCQFGTCACPAGLTNCDGDCVNLLDDVENCGACGNLCPGPSKASSGGGPSCAVGECSYVCVPGFADCDGRVANGCEVNLDTDQSHCGDCKTTCDVKAGQPCITGKCLTKTCEDPTVR